MASLANAPHKFGDVAPMEGADRRFEALEVTLVSHRNRNGMSAYAFSEPGDRIAEFADGRGESRASSYGVLAAIKSIGLS